MKNSPIVEDDRISFLERVLQQRVWCMKEIGELRERVVELVWCIWRERCLERRRIIYLLDGCAVSVEFDRRMFAIKMMAIIDVVEGYRSCS